MGHLSVAAHDYLLTGERGRWAAGRGEEGVGAGRLSRRPWDLWQVSAARFPDRSSGLEFIWVTATGVVCCDKRLMGRALGSSVRRDAWPRGSCRRGGLGCGQEESRAPRCHRRPSPRCPRPRRGGRRRGCLLPWQTPPSPFIPGPQPSSSPPPLPTAQGAVNVCLLEARGGRWGPLAPAPREAGPEPRDISPAAPAAAPSREEKCSFL